MMIYEIKYHSYNKEKVTQFTKEAKGNVNVWHLSPRGGGTVHSVLPGSTVRLWTRNPKGEGLVKESESTISVVQSWFHPSLLVLVSLLWPQPAAGESTSLTTAVIKVEDDDESWPHSEQDSKYGLIMRAGKVGCDWYLPVSTGLFPMLTYF